MDYCMFRRKYLVGWFGKLVEVSKQQKVIEYQPDILLFYHIVLCSFPFLSNRVLFPQQAMLKSMPAHIGHCGPKPG